MSNSNGKLTEPSDIPWALFLDVDGTLVETAADPDAVHVDDRLSISALKPTDTVKLGPGKSVKDAPIAVLGPGTGLGMLLLVPDGKSWLPVATEGGHVTLPAADEEDEAVIALLRTQFGHVSAERVLSGPGLANLYNAISADAGGNHRPGVRRQRPACRPNAG